MTRLDVVECRRLAAGLNGDHVGRMEVDRVIGEVVGSAGVVEVTVGTDDDTSTIVLVNQSTMCQVRVQITHAQSCQTNSPSSPKTNRYADHKSFPP